MIPVNDAITAALISNAAVVLIMFLACRGYWRGRVLDAYQDGHSAGIQTQIGRHQRVTARLSGRRARDLDAYMERAARPGDSEPVTDVSSKLTSNPAPGDGTDIRAGVIPFPEGLPPGLREYATGVMVAAAAAAVPPPLQVRGTESLERIVRLTGPPPSGPR